MNEETKQALEESIAKWQAIVDGTGTDLGGSNCALCQKFVTTRASIDTPACYGCPVKKRTGRTGCAETPYDDWLTAELRANCANRPLGQPMAGSLEIEVARNAAKAELDFLISLRED